MMLPTTLSRAGSTGSINNLSEDTANDNRSTNSTSLRMLPTHSTHTHTHTLSLSRPGSINNMSSMSNVSSLDETVSERKTKLQQDKDRKGVFRTR